MTPVQVQDAVLHNVGEPEALFHTRETVMAYAQHGEQLLGMLRAITEKTIALPLVYNQALYAIHTPAPDFIFPLRVTILKKQVYRTTFSRVVDRDPQWARRVGRPEQYFMVGSTHIGFYPTSPSSTLNAMVTYIAQPAVPTDAGSFFTGSEWHEAMVHYAAAILLAKEQKYEAATEHMQHFFTKAGIERDPRFASPETMGEKGSQTLHPITEVATG